MAETEINDGGPAFPWDELNDDGTLYHCNPGMSLRDWFAGQIAAAIASDIMEQGTRNAAPAEKVFRVLATNAYAAADAMLSARASRGAAS